MNSKIPKIIEGDFHAVINKAIKENRHTDYLKNVLKEYEEYKKVFAQVFTDKNPTGNIYLFQANYLLEKPVWREIAILGNQTFNDLAEAIIYSMDWENDHMHGFSLPSKKNKGDFYYSPFTFYAPDWEDDPFPTYKSNQIRICDFNYDLYPKLDFVFDFGDNHEFEIILKKVDNARKNTQKEFPLLVDQRGVAPEQYPDYEQDFDEKEIDDHEPYSDNCKLCQQLKTQGVEMEWFPDNSSGKKIIS